MRELSRRLFLFGSAAAVAAASVPFAVKEVIHVPFVTKVEALQPFKRRLVTDFMAAFDSNNSDGVALVDLFANDKNLLHLSLNQRGSVLRFCPRHAECPLIAGSEIMLLDVKSEGGLGSVQMMCLDWVDDTDYPVEVCELHHFPARGPAQIAMMYPDNSLKARRRRAEDRIKSSD